MPSSSNLQDTESLTLAELKSKFEEMHMQGLPGPIRRRIGALKSLQKDHFALQAELDHEILQLERKYVERFEPLYVKRAQIVKGDYEPTDEEAAIDVPKEDLTEPIVKGIPEFWAKVLLSYPDLSDMITEADQDALKYLADVHVSFPDPTSPAFTLEFTFENNPYFENKVLTKAYLFEKMENEHFFSHAEGTIVEWKAGKNLTMKTVTKTQRHKTKNTTRTVTREEACPSFFHFFTPPKPPKPSAEGEEDNPEDDDAFDEYQSKVEIDFECGENLKDKIIPNAVNYYLGLCQSEDDEGCCDHDEEEEDSEEDDEEDEEEEASHRRPGQGHHHRHHHQQAHSHGQTSSRPQATNPRQSGPSGAGTATQCAQQ